MVEKINKENIETQIQIKKRQGRYIYLDFREKLPPEAIEHAPKEITRKGYDTTGYQYAYIVERLNEILGMCGIGWHYEWKILKEEQGEWGGGKKYWDITVQIWVIISPHILSYIKQPVTTIGIGGHRAETYYDALKGSITSGFKKAVSFWGLGNDAYKGIIDEDYRAWERQKKGKEESFKKFLIPTIPTIPTIPVIPVIPAPQEKHPDELSISKAQNNLLRKVMREKAITEDEMKKQFGLKQIKVVNQHPDNTQFNKILKWMGDFSSITKGKEQPNGN